MSWTRPITPNHPHSRRLTISFQIDPLFSFPALTVLPVAVIGHVLSYVSLGALAAFMRCSKEAYSLVVRSYAFRAWYCHRASAERVAMCDKRLGKTPPALTRFDRDPDTEGVENEQRWATAELFREAAR